MCLFIMLYSGLYSVYSVQSLLPVSVSGQVVRPRCNNKVIPRDVDRRHVMTSRSNITVWTLPDTAGGPNITGGQLEIYLGTLKNVSAEAEDLREERWNINTMLAICLGPLAVVLLISYVIHWFQVVQRVKRNIKTRRLEMMEVPHNKVSTMMSIQTLENERSGLYSGHFDKEEQLS